MFNKFESSSFFSCTAMAVIFFSSSLLGGCSGAQRKVDLPPEGIEKQGIEEIIPYTMGNIKWHKTLYKEGWRVVTSSEKALSYAKEKSIKSSGDAIAELLVSYGERTGAFGENMKGDAEAAGRRMQKVFKEGTEKSRNIVEKTHALGRREINYGEESFRMAWSRLIKGNMSIVARTEADRKELVALPHNYYSNIKKDYSNIKEATDSFLEKVAQPINDSWEEAFRKAGYEFRKQYEISGQQGNSLTALGPLLYGYLKAFYEGIAAPSSKTIVKKGITGTSRALFLPASATVVAGRTVQSAGLAVYYSGKSGLNIIAPTVESGFYSGLAILSLGTVPLTYASGITLGAVNQVAFTAGAPVAGTAEGVGRGTADTAKYVGFLAYDSVKGTTKVVINQTSAGIALGYNALTAIPMHLLVGAVDSAIFLAWDGPRLVLVKASGQVGERYNPGDLPSGVVVDINEMRKEKGIHVEVLSEDPRIIKEVIEKIPCDLREGGRACEE